MNNKVKIKIAEIEFETEGDPELIRKERENFQNNIFPKAIEALMRVQTNRDKLYDSNKTKPDVVRIVDNVEAVEDKYNLKTIDKEKESLSSFLNQYGDLTENDFILLSAYFYDNYHAKDIFSLNDVKSYYKIARRPLGSNTSAELRNLVKKGYIMDAESPEGEKIKHYALTKDGMNYVETYTPREKKISKKKIKASTIKKQSKYEGITIDDLNLKDFPKITDCKNSKEQIVLIMHAITESKKGEWFSVSDLEYLLKDMLGINVSYSAINSFFNRNKSWFQTKNSDLTKEVERRLLNEGKEFAKSLFTNNGYDNSKIIEGEGLDDRYH